MSAKRVVQGLHASPSCLVPTGLRFDFPPKENKSGLMEGGTPSIARDLWCDLWCEGVHGWMEASRVAFFEDWTGRASVPSASRRVGDLFLSRSELVFVTD